MILTQMPPINQGLCVPGGTAGRKKEAVTRGKDGEERGRNKMRDERQTVLTNRRVERCKEAH